MAAVIILCFELGGVVDIVAPAGFSQVVQFLYVGIGTAIAVCAMALWFTDLHP